MFPLKTGDFDISSFFELTPDLVCIAGKDGYFKKINGAVRSKLEYSEEELLQSPIASFIHPDDQGLTHEKRQKLLEGEALINFQNRYRSKSGKVIWLHWTSVYFPEQEVVFAIAKDVTEKKLIEQEMEARYREFKSLARHFKQRMEKDRKYVALELHEELAQLASMIKMNMDWLESHTDALPEGARGRMEQVSKLSGRMVHTIREIAFSFSPGMLEDLGLKETLAVLCREFQVRKGIPCTFDCTLDPGLLTNEEAMDFFRICQDLFNNMDAGPRVAEVVICLEREQQQACLRVLMIRLQGDSTQPHPEPDLGGIRNRVASMNGQLSVAREGHSHWQMTVRVPLPLPVADDR
ncbi:PAS domain S-box protein [Flaviaesturariibacter aridisoli]|nr:PAS domain S-box protein [Flaviaesturariibacter aridisoli]